MAELIDVEHRLGRLDEIPVGEGRAYAAGNDMVAVFRLRDGGVRAVSAICPHAGGPLADGLADLRVVVCPLHQHTFDLATGCSTTAAPALTVYPVRVDTDGHVVVGRPAAHPTVDPPTAHPTVDPPTAHPTVGPSAAHPGRTA